MAKRFVSAKMPKPDGMNAPTPPQEAGGGRSDLSDPQRKLQDLLASMWEQRKGAVLERLRTLEEAVAGLKAGESQTGRETGIDAAHKLAGILGTFGIPQGTEMAREVEVTLTRKTVYSADDIAHLQALMRELASLVAQRALPSSR